jgi:hypothetical protein
MLTDGHAKLLYRVHTSPPLGLILSQMNPIYHILTLLFNTYFHVSIPGRE